MASRDDLYSRPEDRIEPFEFNRSVAHVFDDMAERSIPHYREVQRMIATLVRTFYQPGTALYDLGCSTGTTLVLSARSLEEWGVSDYHLVGMDSSGPMCEEAKEKLLREGLGERNIEVIRRDITDAEFLNPSVVILNYTLQFVRPLERERLISRIYHSLSHNGVLLVSDKTLQSHTDISRCFIDNYYAFKRGNGYSELEISRKREALENVLIPYRIKEEENLFRQCGFEAVDILFSWFNFTSFLCMKKD